MARISMPGASAWLNAAKGPSARWSDDIDRFSAEIADVAHSPKFRIGKNDSFFCIGSCFARNIEEHLIYCGVNVLSRKIFSPKQEWPYRVNGFVNKFTTHSIRNEVEWVVSRPKVGTNFFEELENGWVDRQLAPGLGPVSLDRAIERRAYLIEEYFSRIRSASVIVLTLGLNEVWFDRAAGVHLNAPPSFYATRRDNERFEMHVTDVAENVRELDEIRRLVLTINPDAKFVVTVSPVPMSETFSGRDIVMANMYSKSTLRAAAENFFQSHDNVDYFPSLEIVSMTPRCSAYAKDCLHVSDPIVGRLMQMFLCLYLGFEPVSFVFNEIAYLEANPDVEAAVRREEFSSGFEHWRRFGQEEGRLLSPSDGPTPFMIAAGVVQ